MMVSFLISLFIELQIQYLRVKSTRQKILVIAKRGQTSSITGTFLFLLSIKNNEKQVLKSVHV